MTAPDTHPGVGDCGICPASQHRGGAGWRGSLGLCVSIMHRSSGVTVPARIAPALQMAFRIPGQQQQQQHGPPRCSRGRVGGSLLTLAKRLRNETDMVGQASGWFKPRAGPPCLGGGGKSCSGLGCLTGCVSLPAARAPGAVSSPGQPMPAGGRKPAEARQEPPHGGRATENLPGQTELPCCPALGFQTSGTQNLKAGPEARSRWDFCMHVRRRRVKFACHSLSQPRQLRSPASNWRALICAASGFCIVASFGASSRLCGQGWPMPVLDSNTPLSRPGAKRRRRQRDGRLESASFLVLAFWSYAPGTRCEEFREAAVWAVVTKASAATATRRARRNGHPNACITQAHLVWIREQPPSH